MRSILPTFVAIVGLSGSLFAQQADDYALRFNGTTDFVAMPQTATAINSFTIDLWVNPTAEHQVDAESFAGYDGIKGQRYALFPSHGTHCWGPGHAGVGLSVGTNGISVYEHAGDYIPAVLVHEQQITDWTRVTLVYRDRVPSLYVDGRLVRVGKASPRTVHPSTGDAHPGRMISGIGGGPYGYFAGDVDNVRIWSTSLTADEVASPRIGTDDKLVLSLNMNQSGAGRGLIVGNRSSLENAPLVMTHGTEQTPVFALRVGRYDTRVDARVEEPVGFSTPIEFNRDNATTGAATLPTIE
jgi:hypothetical protein